MTAFTKFSLPVLAIAALIAANLLIHNGALAQTADLPERVDLLEFPGGSVTEYVEAVRAAFGDVNIVAQGATEQFSVPAVRLHNVTLYDLMMLLQHVGTYILEEPDVSGSVMARQVGGTWVVSASVYRASTGRPGRPPAPPPPRAITRVFSIMEILSEFSVDDIITSVETALALETEADPPEARPFTPDHPGHQAALRARPAPPDLRLHEETGLLIVRGLPDQVMTVDSVVDALRDTALTRRTQAQYISREEHERLVSLMDREIRELRALVRTLQPRGIEDDSE